MATWDAGYDPALSYWDSNDSFATSIKKQNGDNSWSSWCKSTGQALGSATSTITVNYTVNSSDSWAFIAFSSATTPSQQSTDETDGISLSFYPTATPPAEQKVKIRYPGNLDPGTDYVMSYDENDTFTITMTTTNVIFKKNGTEFATITAWTPTAASTYYMYCNHYSINTNMVGTYSSSAVSSGGTRLPPPPLIARF